MAVNCKHEDSNPSSVALVEGRQFLILFCPDCDNYLAVETVNVESK